MPAKMASAQQIPGLAETAWGLHEQQAKYPALQQSTTADVVVVGAGIAGLSIAYNLVKASKRVIVLDMKLVGSGQTGRTTAHIMPWFDDYYSELEAQRGSETVALVGRAHTACTDWIEKVVNEEDIDCDFARVDGYLYADDESKKTAEKLREELEACHRAGLTQVKMVDLEGKADVGGVRAALRFSGAGEFDPIKYCQGLAEAIVKHGGQICEQSKVMKTEGSLVQTADGASITTPHVVLACNSPPHHNLAVHSRQEPMRSYVIGLKLPKGDYREGTHFWSTEEPSYTYIRSAPLPGSSEEVMLMVGGGDHPTGIKPGDYPDSYGQLEKYARQRWPTAGAVVQRWSGQVFEPIDMLGLAGKDPFNDYQTGDATYWTATGDSGQGMTMGTIAGWVVSDLILGRENKLAKIYDPSRLPNSLSSGQALLQGPVATITQSYTDLVVPAAFEVQSTDLAPGTGAVLQSGVDKVAVYKDEMGVTRKMSALCPHLKCPVTWNPQVKTFDCACHGSHFDCAGKVIQGPAKADLEELF